MESDVNLNDVMLKYKGIGALGVPSNGKLIYFLLSDQADEKREVQIPIKDISRSLKISIRAVRHNLRCLENVGHIHIIPQYHSDSGRAANKYIVR
jgi:predicted ArsR family transcriptional regulator